MLFFPQPLVVIACLLTLLIGGVGNGQDAEYSPPPFEFQGIPLTPRELYETIPTRPEKMARAESVQQVAPPGQFVESLAPLFSPTLGDRSLKLPKKFTALESFLPTPGEQRKDQNDCVAWAVAYASYTCQICQERRRLEPTSAADLFSPSFIFRKLDQGNKGLHAVDVIDLVRREGCASLATMPKDHQALSREAAAEAATFRARYHRRAEDLEDIKRYLFEGYPVILIIDVDSEFYRNDQTKGDYLWSQANNRAYHAITAIGYDDEREHGQGALRIMNSWGTDWKDQGFCWVSYANFDAGIGIDRWCGEAHVIGIKEVAPFNESIFSEDEDDDFGDRDFELRADRKVYERSRRISPDSWQIDDLVVAERSLFVLSHDQKLYRMNESGKERSWTHLSSGQLSNRKVRMMAAGRTSRLHVLTDDGVVYSLDMNTGRWEPANLPGDQKATAVDLRTVAPRRQLRATKSNGNVYVHERSGWALAS